MPGAGVIIGLVSDTHGQFREELRAALEGVAFILHAGDVGGGQVLRQLREIAPVQAVWGNVDDRSDPNLVREISLNHDGVTIHVSHGHELGSPTPDGLLRAYTEDVLVFGHTHRALVETAGGRLVVNPGAAGPRRFKLRPSVARLAIVNGAASATIVWL
jgi:putative phosphoesterase